MIAMAFSEGHNALAPKCWERSSSGQCCGSTLVQIPDHEERAGDKKGSPLVCRGKSCGNSPNFICKISNHTKGLCSSCASRETDTLLGPQGSTHVYNGHIGRVDAGGKLYINGFGSRKPPMDETGASYLIISSLVVLWFNVVYVCFRFFPFFCSFQGNKQRQIHWRSTKRLAVPNLVGVIRLGDSSCVPPRASDPKSYRGNVHKV
jgi:hypothetical protein